MEVQYSKSSLKFLAKIEKKQRERIKSAINDLTLTPPKGDIKPLQGYIELYRLRVGSYRIIYKFTAENEIDILYIIDIGNRGDVYK